MRKIPTKRAKRDKAWRLSLKASRRADRVRAFWVLDSMVKPVDHRRRNPSSSVTTRSVLSTYPLMRKNSWAWPISMIIRGSPEGLGKTCRILRGPCVVVRMPPGERFRLFAKFSSTSTAPASKRKDENVSSPLLLFAEAAIDAVIVRTSLSRKGSTPSMRTCSPPSSLILRSITGARYLTAVSPMSSASSPSSMGPAGREMVWVVPPRRKSTALPRLSRAAREASIIPTAAATPKAMPRSWRMLRLFRRRRYLRNARTTPLKGQDLRRRFPQKSCRRSSAGPCRRIHRCSARGSP